MPAKQWIEVVRRLLSKYSEFSWKRYLIAAATTLPLYLITRYLFLKIRQKYVLKLPPGPIGYIPFMNSIPMLMSYGMLEFHKTVAHQYGPLCTYSIGLSEFIILNDPIIANNIFKGPKKQDTTLGNTECPDPRGWMESNHNRNIFGNNFVSVRNLKRLFSHQSLTYKYLDIGISKSLNKLIFNQLEGDNKTVDVEELIKPLHFCILWYAITGVSIDSLNDKLWTNFYKISKPVFKEVVDKNYPNLIFGRKPKKSNSKINFNDDTALFSPKYKLCLFIDEFISKHNKVLLENKNAFYTRLVDQHFNNYSLDEAKNEYYTKNELLFDISTMLFAGIDTINSVMHSLIMNICKYQDIQENIYNELMNIFENNNNNEYDSKILQNELKKNKNLNNFQSFIFEILRLFSPYSPIIIGIIRIAKNDIKVNVNDSKSYMIPNGAAFQNNVLGIHYNDKYWGNKHEGIKSDELYLNNFKDSNGIFKKSNNLFTFGAGPRMCPGMHFALKEINILFAHLIFKYKMVFDPDHSNIKNKALKDIDIKLTHYPETGSPILCASPNIRVQFINRK